MHLHQVSDGHGHQLLACYAVGHASSDPCCCPLPFSIVLYAIGLYFCVMQRSGAVKSA